MTRERRTALVTSRRFEALLTEFLRIFEHDGYRYYLEDLHHTEAPGPLAKTNKWMTKYFKNASRKERDRLLL